MLKYKLDRRTLFNAMFMADFQYNFDALGVRKNFLRLKKRLTIKKKDKLDYFKIKGIVPQGKP